MRAWSHNHWTTGKVPKILFCYEKFQEHIKESCVPTTPHTQHPKSVTTYVYHPVSVLCIEPSFFLFFFFFKLFVCIYFLVVLGLHCCTGYSVVVIHWLILTASLVVVCGLPKHRLNSCGARA